MKTLLKVLVAVLACSMLALGLIACNGSSVSAENVTVDRNSGELDLKSYIAGGKNDYTYSFAYKFEGYGTETADGAAVDFTESDKTPVPSGKLSANVDGTYTIYYTVAKGDKVLVEEESFKIEVEDKSVPIITVEEDIVFGKYEYPDWNIRRFFKGYVEVEDEFYKKNEEFSVDYGKANEIRVIKIDEETNANGFQTMEFDGEGEHTITIEATDGFGNSATKEIPVTVDFDFSDTINGWESTDPQAVISTNTDKTYIHEGETSMKVAVSASSSNNYPGIRMFNNYKVLAENDVITFDVYNTCDVVVSIAFTFVGGWQAGWGENAVDLKAKEWTTVTYNLNDISKEVDRASDTIEGLLMVVYYEESRGVIGKAFDLYIDNMQFEFVGYELVSQDLINAPTPANEQVNLTTEIDFTTHVNDSTASLKVNINKVDGNMPKLTFAFGDAGVDGHNKILTVYAKFPETITNPDVTFHMANRTPEGCEHKPEGGEWHFTDGLQSTNEKWLQWEKQDNGWWKGTFDMSVAEKYLSCGDASVTIFIYLTINVDSALDANNTCTVWFDQMTFEPKAA